MKPYRLLNLPQDKPTIVIIGGGFAGINFIKTIKSQNCNVVLVDKHNYHQFQPLLYQVAISGLEPDSIVAPFRKLFNQTRNIHFVMGEVLKINRAEKCVELNVGTLSYDKLIIAAGNKTNFYGNENMEKKAFGLKDINDALNIRSWILQQLEKASLEPQNKALTHFVVAGAGPAGIEMAGALAEFCSKLLAKDYPRVNKNYFQITLIEGGGQLLAAMSKKAQNTALEVLQKIGVNVIVNTIVKDFDGTRITYVQGDKTFSLYAETLIWTAGVNCAVIDGIHSESITFQNRLAVSEYLKVKGEKDIFAIGDIAYLETKEFPKGLPMVAQSAIQQGTHLAKHILKENPTPFIYKDKGSMATIGMKNAVADVKSVFFQGKSGWFLWSIIHLISITSFKNRLTTGINWIMKYFSYDKANQLIIRNVKK